MRNFIPLAQVIDVYGVIEDLVLNVKCDRIEVDYEVDVYPPITSNELLTVQQWYVTAWAMHLQVSSRQRKEKPEVRVGNLMEFAREFTPHGSSTSIPEGTLCRVVFPPRKVGYGLAPSTVRVCVVDDYLTVPLHFLTTLWTPLRPEDAQMTASRKWHGRREVGEDIMRMWSPLTHKCLVSHVDNARALSKVCAYGKPLSRPESCNPPSPISEHQQD